MCAGYWLVFNFLKSLVRFYLPLLLLKSKQNFPELKKHLPTGEGDSEEFTLNFQFCFLVTA